MTIKKKNEIKITNLNVSTVANLTERSNNLNIPRNKYCQNVIENKVSLKHKNFNSVSKKVIEELLNVIYENSKLIEELDA